MQKSESKQNTPQYEIRPASLDETGLFFGMLPEKDMAQEEKPLIGRVTFLNGDIKEFEDATEFIGYIREELPYHQTTGFRYEVLTDNPVTRKAADDIVYDLYGEKNQHPLEDYKNGPEQGMQMGVL